MKNSLGESSLDECHWQRSCYPLLPGKKLFEKSKFGSRKQ